ncbi:Uncharacterised protein [Candidatus Gugararchaeum adminiculabundum]|nr:Uncharacterised protein [Candidatus Gugararchaeum adminiculabundum]
MKNESGAEEKIMRIGEMGKLKSKTQKGFIFALVAFILATLLLSFALVVADRQLDAEKQQALYLTADKISGIFSDVAEDAFTRDWRNVTKVNATLNVQEYLPIPDGQDYFMLKYGYFVENYYEPPDVAISFLDLNGTEISLDQMDYYLDVFPFNMTLDYGRHDHHHDGTETYLSCYGYYLDKHGHAKTVSAYGCANYLTGARMDIIINTTFRDNATLASAASCGGHDDWVDGYSGCDAQTTVCLQMNVTITDVNGSVYTSPCHQWDLEGDAKIKIDTRYYDSQNNGRDDNMEIDIGHDQIFNIDMHHDDPNGANINLVLNFNTQDFWVRGAGQLRVRDLNYNNSVTQQLQLGDWTWR